MRENGEVKPMTRIVMRASRKRRRRGWGYIMAESRDGNGEWRRGVSGE